MIRMPVRWPLNKGFSFTCWLRVETFSSSGKMGLFSFLTESGRGCFAVIAKDRLTSEVTLRFFRFLFRELAFCAYMHKSTHPSAVLFTVSDCY